MGEQINHAIRALVVTAIAAIVGLAAALTAAPAHAGQDITITLNNRLPKTQPEYPRLALRGTDSMCWYSRDFDRDDLSAPAGGGYANVTSEVRNTFFSFCSPTWNPLKDALVRWQQFQLVAQVEPGGPWETVMWGDQYSKFLLSYWKIVMDVRGYHFDLTGPSAGTPLQTPVGKACLGVEPRLPFNYSGLFTMTVTKAESGTCAPAAAVAGRRTVQDRNVRLRVDNTRHVVLGQVTGRRADARTRWQVRRDQCTSAHFDAESARIRRGPGGSRWQVVSLRGVSTGRDSCVIDLVGPRQQKLMTQRVAITVK